MAEHTKDEADQNFFYRAMQGVWRLNTQRPAIKKVVIRSQNLNATRVSMGGSVVNFSSQEALRGIGSRQKGHATLQQLRLRLSPSSVARPQTKIDIPYPFSDHWPQTVSAEDKLFFASLGLPRQVVSALREGSLAHVASLDLHHMTVTQAKMAVSRFLVASVETACWCVRIVHGKGTHSQDGPILKNYVNSWLREHEAVSAFCSSPPRAGGSGAVDVLLRGAQFRETDD